MNDVIETIRSMLTDDTKRIIVRYCREPRSSSEIVNRVMSVRRVEDHFLYERVIANDLKEMEEAGAISYSHEGWKTNEITVNILKKYFGE